MRSEVLLVDVDVCDVDVATATCLLEPVGGELQATSGVRAAEERLDADRATLEVLALHHPGDCALADGDTCSRIERMRDEARRYAAPAATHDRSHCGHSRAACGQEKSRFAAYLLCILCRCSASTTALLIAASRGLAIDKTPHVSCAHAEETARAARSGGGRLAERLECSCGTDNLRVALQFE